MNKEQFISYSIHPIIFGIITTLVYFMFSPNYIPKELKINIIGIVFISTYVIPIIFLFLLKSFNSINSFHLFTIQERKFPLFFFIILNLLLSQRLMQIPKMEILAIFFLASSISLFIAYLFLFFKIKISLHTLALGLFTTFLGILSYYFKIKLLFLIASLFLLSGIVAHVRLKLGAHNNLEVYLGFLIGVLIEMSCFIFLLS